MSVRNDLTVLVQLGMRIAYLRKQRRLTQLDLSFDSGIAKSFISELEKGKRNPSVATLTKICGALHITLEELFRGIVPLEDIII